MGTPATGRGHSVWLMPGGAGREILAGWIDRLAERFRCEPFPPHVTLVSGLEAAAGDLAGALAGVAATLRPFTVHVDGVDGRDEHFRCLFVQAVETRPLVAAHEAVSRALSREPEAAYFPHLSLVYGSLRPDQKHGLAHEVGSDADVRFEAERLHLWSTDGPVASWREVGVFPFGVR